MRRAVIATAGTVIGLAALLSYKSSGTVNSSRVTVGTGDGGAGGTVVVSTTTTTLPTTATTTATGSGAGGGTTTTTTTAAVSGKVTERTYVGNAVAYNYGDIQVSITVKGDRIVKISIPENISPDAHSAMINGEAVPVLEQEALAAQGLNFDAVSGATFTSDAFAQSLQSALGKAGL